MLHGLYGLELREMRSEGRQPVENGMQWCGQTKTVPVIPRPRVLRSEHDMSTGLRRLILYTPRARSWEAGVVLLKSLLCTTLSMSPLKPSDPSNPQGPFAQTSLLQVHVRGPGAFVLLTLIHFSLLTLLFIPERPQHPGSSRRVPPPLPPACSKTLARLPPGRRRLGARPYPILCPNPSGKFV